MKTLAKLALSWLLIMSLGQYVAQFDIDTTKKEQIYLVTTNNDGTFIGKILKIDDREILINTEDKGSLYIPKYQIKEIEAIDEGRFTAKGDFIPNEVFSTRYFITTNGLPIEQGENYIQWNLYGPDLQFGVRKNLGIGIMTSWMGMPIIGTAKYSIPVNEKLNFGIGALAGTASWASPQSYGALPFGVVTYGSRKSNINISGGYVFMYLDGDDFGLDGGQMNRPLFSIAGMTKVGKKVSLVFDSFIVGSGGYKTIEGQYNYTTGQYEDVQVKRKGGALLIPGIRIQTQQNNAFQFGFGGLIANDELVPVPIPIVQWYRKI